MLSGFPIAVLPLPDNDDGLTVGDQFAVTYVPSVTAYLHLEGRLAQQDNIVVIADPLIAAPIEDNPLVSMRTARLTLLAPY